MTPKAFFVAYEAKAWAVKQTLANSRPAHVCTFPFESQAVALCATLNNLHHAATDAATMLRRRASMLQQAWQVLDKLLAALDAYNGDHTQVTNPEKLLAAYSEACEFSETLRNSLRHMKRTDSAD